MTSAYKNEVCYKCGKTNDEHMIFFARKNQFDDKRVKTDIFLCGECSQAWDKLKQKNEKLKPFKLKNWNKAWFDLFFDVFMKEKVKVILI